MKNSKKNRLSLSYAKAIYTAAAGENCERQVFSDLQKLKAAVTEDSHIMSMLTNPLWKTKAKKEALSEIGKVLGLNTVTVKSLMTVADNNRLNLLLSIFDDYKSLYYTAENIAEVQVSSIKNLNSEQSELLQKALEKWLKKKVVINSKIEPELLGGLLIECGSVIFDDSVKGKLEKLRNQMKGNK